VDKLLTKGRALALLVLVLAVAAVNRHDAIMYAMGVSLAWIGLLGYALPWIALRSATLEPAGAWPEQAEALEGEPLDLALRLRQRGWWPAWLVEVEAEWTWAGRSFLTRATVAFLPPRASVPVMESLRFACRGEYRLSALRLRSGFPLGLVEAGREAPVPALAIRVRPASAPVSIPAEWTVSEDSHGDQAQGHAGESLELNMLRRYEPGDAVRRVDWRASARAGDLVVRQFQHPASVLVKLLVQLPGTRDVGHADSAAEHAVRVAAAAGALLARQAVQAWLLLPDAPAVETADAMPLALAGALPDGAGWAVHLSRSADALRRGEQILAVVPADAEAPPLVEAARRAAAAGARLMVVIATSPHGGGELAQRASRLREELQAGGVRGWLAWH
jgi:uncharacterized protein (DUF58 family)